MSKKNSIEKQDPYSAFLQTVTGEGDIPKDVAERFLQQFEFMKRMIDLTPCIYYLFDYRTRKYLFMNAGTEAVSGYTSEEWMEKGQAWFVNELVHPEDLAVFSKGPFQKFIDFITTIPNEQIHQHRFSVCYRLKRKDNKYIKVLQQYVIVERDASGNPALNLGIVTDISEFKSDDQIVFTITRYNPESGFITVTSDIFSNIQVAISDREAQVLGLIAGGKSNKMIASALCISENTVRNHRQNLLGKTGCKNTAELVSYAMANGLV